MGRRHGPALTIPAPWLMRVLPRRLGPRRATHMSGRATLLVPCWSPTGPLLVAAIDDLQPAQREVFVETVERGRVVE